ncbi:MAG TPA: 16S rRNA (uracil(1498)-N(3))-methyltransferase [Polyangia bacterium]|nr:16S rRNA (uracil(1498)-N(3))-methyltransferase [Polyangia bacterium]
MARLFVEPSKLTEEIVVLTDEDHRYLTRVLRLDVNDTVTLFDGKSVEATARITRIGPRALELKIEERRPVEAIERPELTLIQALAKGDKLELVVQKATELGVARIIPVTSARAVARLDAGAMRTLSRRARWQKIAREASRQSGRLDVPEVEGVTALSTALQASPKDALKLFFWEGARQTSLRDALPDRPPQQIVFAIGPEGGFTVEEVEAGREAGFIPVGLGPRVLRTETAALVVLSILGYALGDLG